jgi:valyl-tRNA synthetase
VKTTRSSRGQNAGIPVIISVDDSGKFLSDVTDFAGQHVFDANKPITQKLKADGRLLQQKSVRPLVPALLAMPQPAHLQGGLVVVRSRA